MKAAVALRLRRACIGACLLVAAGASPAVSASKWLSLPSPNEMAAVYPPAAQAAHQGGKAVLACEADQNGALHSCAVESEEPAGAGFGEAALKLMSTFKLAAQAGGGWQKVSIPIRFVPDEPVGPPVRVAEFKTDRRWPSPPAGPYHPEVALRAGQRGMAEVDCRVLSDGRLDGCKLALEAPSGFYFGAAALKMAAAGWMTAGPKPQGVPVPADGVWRFQVIYPAYKVDIGGVRLVKPQP